MRRQRPDRGPDGARRPGRPQDSPHWDDRCRTRTALTASVLLAAVAGIAAGTWYGAGAALWLGGTAVLAAGGGAALTAAPARRAAGTALLLIGGTLGVVAGWQAAPAVPSGSPPPDSSPRSGWPCSASAPASAAAASPARPRSRSRWAPGNCCWP
ncbi:hypothetical protein O1L44_18540 [Streptomyces noursei]|nr:hypothetical protein [Streptomyces noursei]